MQPSQRYESSHRSNLEVVSDTSKTVYLPSPVQTQSTERGKQNVKSRNTKSGTHRPSAGNTLLDY